MGNIEQYFSLQYKYSSYSIQAGLFMWDLPKIASEEQCASVNSRLTRKHIIVLSQVESLQMDFSRIVKAYNVFFSGEKLPKQQPD